MTVWTQVIAWLRWAKLDDRRWQLAATSGKGRMYAETAEMRSCWAEVLGVTQDRK
jgi:hypothetical protein